VTATVFFEKRKIQTGPAIYGSFRAIMNSVSIICDPRRQNIHIHCEAADGIGHASRLMDGNAEIFCCTLEHSHPNSTLHDEVNASFFRSHARL